MNEDLSRYARQTVLTGFGEEGQRLLLSSRVVVAGCGALGSMVASILVRAGVGNIVMADRDLVERTNLHRQFLFVNGDVGGLPKAVVARERLSMANPDCRVEAVVADINRRNVEDLLKGSDLVVDGADNFELRCLVNEACVRFGIPWVHGAVQGSYGVQFTVIPGETACLNCLVEEAPPPGTLPTCVQAGVFTPVVAMVAATQAAEAIKLLTRNRQRLRSTMMAVDAWTNQRSEVAVGRLAGEPGCRVCVRREYDYLEGRKGSETTALCGTDQVQVLPPPGARVSIDDLARRLEGALKVTASPFLLRFSVEGCDIAVFPDGRAIVRGTDDPVKARAIVAKYVGV